MLSVSFDKTPEIVLSRSLPGYYYHLQDIRKNNKKEPVELKEKETEKNTEVEPAKNDIFEEPNEEDPVEDLKDVLETERKITSLKTAVDEFNEMAKSLGTGGVDLTGVNKQVDAALSLIQMLKKNMGIRKNKSELSTFHNFRR